MNVDEQRIREFAYQIWQSEGCPAGQESRHWEMACKLAEAEAAAPTARPAARPRRASKPKEAPPANDMSSAETAATQKPRATARKTTSTKAAK
jgi:hypothetical protein